VASLSERREVIAVTAQDRGRRADIDRPFSYEPMPTTSPPS
jgi:hypothetical protein